MKSETSAHHLIIYSILTNINFHITWCVVWVRVRLGCPSSNVYLYDAVLFLKEYFCSLLVAFREGSLCMFVVSRSNHSLKSKSFSRSSRNTQILRFFFWDVSALVVAVDVEGIGSCESNSKTAAPSPSLRSQYEQSLSLIIGITVK